MSTKVQVSTSTKLLGDTTIFFTSFKEEKGKRKITSKGLSAEVSKRAQAALESGFKSDFLEHILYREANLDGHRNILFIGLGSAAKVTGECLRRAAGSATRDLHMKAKALNFVCENVASSIKDKNLALQAFSEGAIMGGYRFDELKEKNKKDSKKESVLEIILVCKNASEAKSAGKLVEKGSIIGEAVNFARRMGDLPGNILTPTMMAEEAQRIAKGTKLKVTVWDRARIEKENMGNFIGVAKGSDEPCKFIIMEYRGGAAKSKPICFVGKGLTFDSGGISLKPGAGMEEMKYDMCGGAAVIGAMAAIAQLKLKVNALAYVPATENMPNGKANKPGDVTVARNGKSTEVANTDAEGRLILSDALVYASEQKPGCILDAATLTGAMAMALGDTHTGYFTNDPKIGKFVDAAAEEAGETIWKLPLVREHSQDMQGLYADLCNISHSKGAGSAKGAAYLQEFVGEGIPWAHFDIAGTAWNTGHRLPYNPKKGASGVILRTFVKCAERWK